MALEGKRISELARTSTVSSTDLVVVDRGGVESNSVYVRDLLTGLGNIVAIDNKSITQNSSDQIQTVGVIDQNNTSNAIKTWTGTRAEYDLIDPKDPNTLYNITDDLDAGGGSYVLPPATANTLGGIKVGANLTVQSDGTLSATGGVVPNNVVLKTESPELIGYDGGTDEGMFGYKFDFINSYIDEDQEVEDSEEPQEVQDRAKLQYDSYYGLEFHNYPHTELDSELNLRNNGDIEITADGDIILNKIPNVDGIDLLSKSDGEFIDESVRCGKVFQQLVAVHAARYTAPANGYFSLDGILVNAANNRLYLLHRNDPYIYGNRLCSMTYGAWSSYRQYVWVPVSKGDEIAITAESTAPNPDFSLRFYYANGEDIPIPRYTKVEYIQGQYNTQYIKSGIIPTSDMKIYCKLQNTSSTLGFGWGCRNVTYDGAQMSVNATNQNIVVDWFGASAEDRWTLSTSVATTDIFELTIENNVAEIKKNGSVIGTHTFTPTATVTRELFLTGFNNNGTLGGAGAIGNLYEYKLWSPEGDLLLDMIPVKDSSNVACMYNRVNHILYYNQGTGSYTAGPDVN